MTRIPAAEFDDMPESTRQNLAFAEELMGFTPNDALVMAHWPEMTQAMQQLVAVIYGPGEVDAVLKRLVAAVTSAAAGCRYCQAHTAHGAAEMAGADAEKVAAVWNYQTSDLFNDAERAALDLALAAGTQPNAATDAHFETLREHFSARQITEIMGVISLFGFLNRWNDTLATKLEDAPLKFAEATYTSDVWEAGKHKG